MSIEFIGMIGTQEVSEILPAAGPVLDPALVRRFAAAHEEAGFDKVLIGHSSSTPDGLQVAAYAAAHTDRLGFLVAHRPGFTAPTLAARQYATLDHFSGGGRVAMHVISGGSDTDQRRDGDWLGKDERYARTDEYLSVVRRAWTEPEPFDHTGEHYRVAGVAQEIRPLGPIPVYFGGSSDAAYRVGGRHADVFALWGEPLAGTAEQIARVHDAAPRAAPSHPGSACRSARSSATPRSRPGPAPTTSATGSSPPAAGTARSPEPGCASRGPGQRRVAAPARRRRGRGAARPLPVDGHRGGLRRGRELHRPGRHPGHRRRGARRLRRHRRQHAAHPRLRPDRRRPPLRPRAAARSARRARPPRRGRRGGGPRVSAPATTGTVWTPEGPLAAPSPS